MIKFIYYYLYYYYYTALWLRALANTGYESAAQSAKRPRALGRASGSAEGDSQC